MAGDRDRSRSPVRMGVAGPIVGMSPASSSTAGCGAVGLSNSIGSADGVGSMGLMSSPVGLMGSGMGGMGMMPAMPMGGMGGTMFMPMGGMGGMMGPMQMMMPIGAMPMMGAMGGMMGTMGGVNGMGGMGALPMAMNGASTSGVDSFEPADELNKQQEDKARIRAMARIRAGAGAIVEDELDDGGYGGNTSNTSHPSYRPPNMEKIAGLTDRRFEGYIHFWHREQGYGFIKSNQLSKKFPNHDIFLHKNQKGRFEEGDHVTFGLFMNYRGKPQATELRRKKEGAEEDDAG